MSALDEASTGTLTAAWAASQSLMDAADALGMDLPLLAKLSSLHADIIAVLQDRAGTREPQETRGKPDEITRKDGSAAL